MLSISTALVLFTGLGASLPERRSLETSSNSAWAQHALIGQGARQEHSVTALDDQIFILAGVAYNDIGELETINRAEFYRPSDDTWHVAAAIPQPLNHLNVAAVDGRLYLLGGLSGGGNWTARGEGYVYHCSNDSWTGVTPMPDGTARGSSAVGVHEGTIYLAGGMTYLDVTGDGTQDSVATVSSYDTNTDSWNTDYPPLPEPRQHVGGAVVDGTFYVLGGREDGIDENRPTVYALDLRNATAWHTLAPMPTARGGLACAALAHEIFCFGGEGNPDNPRHIFSEVEVYDTRADEWRRLPPMPVPRHGTGAAAAGGRIYIPGGGLVTAASPTGWFDSFAP